MFLGGLLPRWFVPRFMVHTRQQSLDSWDGWYTMDNNHPPSSIIIITNTTIHILGELNGSVLVKVEPHPVSRGKRRNTIMSPWKIKCGYCLSVGVDLRYAVGQLVISSDPGSQLESAGGKLEEW